MQLVWLSNYGGRIVMRTKDLIICAFIHFPRCEND
jgi:hypothetical protein